MFAFYVTDQDLIPGRTYGPLSPARSEIWIHNKE